MSFAKSLTADETATLQAALLQLEGTTKVAVSEAKITVEYDFPTSCFDDIWKIIDKLINPACITLLQRIRHAMAAFAELNESDHRLYPRHWHTYTEDIYVQYFNYEQSGKSETREQLWRRYRKNP